jgi:hypothetical protein
MTDLLFPQNPSQFRAHTKGALGMNPARTTPIATAALLAVLVTTAGCSASTTGPARAAVPSAAPQEPTIGAVPQLATTVGKTLPIEAYLFTEEQRRQLDSARDVLAVQCMKKFGIAYTPVAESASSRSQTAHRYDVIDPANGYRSSDPRTPPATPNLTPEQATVLTGSLPGKPAGTYQGSAVPAGGCNGEAARQLTSNGGSLTDSELAVNINFDNYRRSMTDDRLRAVFQTWSDCMKAKGFAYATPADAMRDKRWLTGATASPEEIATATADSACRQQTNVVGTWFAVESADEAQAIKDHLPELTQIRQGMDQVLKSASAVTP